MNPTLSNEVSNPSYPTLNQVRSIGAKHPIFKIACITAITASMALAAGCGPDYGGETTCFTEPTRITEPAD